MPPDDKPRSRLETAEIVAKIIAAILIPTIGGIYTCQRNGTEQTRLSQQASADSQQRQADRLALLLKYLGSETIRERLLGIRVAQYLSAQDLLPAPVIPVLVEIASKGTEDEVKSATQVLQSLPPRVYVHITSEAQRDLAVHAVSALAPIRVLVPAIQMVDSAPNRTQLRYFRDEDLPEAEHIGATLIQTGLQVDLLNLTKEFQGTRGLRGNTFEL